MSRTIDYIQVTIQPYGYAETSRNIKELRIKVQTYGQTYTTIKVLDDDDFTSRFDYLMETARQEIIKLIQDQEPTP